MVTQQEIRKCGQAIVECINVKKGDGIVVQEWLHQTEILEEVIIGLYERGAVPYLNISWDRIEQRKMETIDADILEIAPRHKTELFQAMDAFIALERYENPAIQHTFPREKIAAVQKSSGAWRDILYDEKDGKKWLYAGWPTKAAAQMYGIEYEDLERFTIGGMMVPVSELKEKCAALEKLLTRTTAIHVWDSQGSDFVAEVTG